MSPGIFSIEIIVGPGQQSEVLILAIGTMIIAMDIWLHDDQLSRIYIYRTFTHNLNNGAVNKCRGLWFSAFDMF